MKHRHHITPRLTSHVEAGFSIIEVTVAMALLVTVLIPLGSFTVQFIGERRNERELRALALGRLLMEETLHLESYGSEERWTPDRKWRMRKTVTRTGRQVRIIIQVYRHPHPDPYLRLFTIRLTS